MIETIAIVRGGGDLGSGVVHRLQRCGFNVLILEISEPLVVRRTVSFAQAVIDGEAAVEGVKALRVGTAIEVRNVWSQGCIPVMVDPEMDIADQIRPEVIIDATLAKRDTGLRKGMAPITIALGPGFKAGVHADVVIETNRGHNLGRLIFDGCAEPNTATPGLVKGYGAERVLRSPCDGRVKHVRDIGVGVKQGDIICYVEGEPVSAPFDGVVRGLIMNGRHVSEKLKIGDVDPRPIKDHCHTISDKARALGGSVLEAILYLKRHKSR
jgi:xanthine dehydrogenase accessory factor